MLAKDTNAFALYIDTNDKVVLDKYGTGWDTNESGTTVDTDWHHFVATNNGSVRHVYKDGVDVTNNMTDMTFASNASPLIIGANSDFSDFMVGDLAEIAVYPTELSFERVTAHYVTGIGKYGYEVLADEPNVWYRMNEPSASFPPVDSSGNNHDADQTGGTMTAYRTAGPLANEVSLGQTFSGSSGHKFPNGAALDVGDVFTMEAWVKRGAGQGTGQTIFLRDGAWQIVLQEPRTGSLLPGKASRSSSRPPSPSPTRRRGTTSSRRRTGRR